MTLQEVADQLSAEATANGLITVDDDLLGRHDVDSLISLHLGRTNILLTVPRTTIAVTQQPTPHILVQGTIPLAVQDSFLNLQGYTASITFKEVDTTVGFVMDITLDPAPAGAQPWKFPTSYPALAGTGADFLPATNQHFLFSSDDIQGQALEGLNYAGQVSLTGPYVFFAPIQQLLLAPGTTTLAMAGAMIPALNCFQLTAVTKVETGSQNLTLFTATNFQLLFTIDTLPNPNQLGTSIVSASFGFSMDVVLGSGNVTGLRARALLSPSAARDLVQLVVAPSDGGLISINDLGNLMGGASWNALFSGSIGQSLSDCFDSFGLISWGASFNLLPTFGFSNTVLTIGCDPTQHYVIVEGSIVLDKLILQWMVVDPINSGPQSFALDAVLTLGDDIRFEVQVNFGASVLSVQGALQGAMPVDLAGWCDDLLQAFGYTDGLPDAISNFFGAGFILTDIIVALVQRGSTDTDFSVTVVGEMAMTTEPTNFEVDFVFVMTAEGWNVRFACSVAVGPATYMGELLASRSTSATSAVWSITAGWENRSNPIGFDEIAYGLGFELPPIPPTLDLNLAAARFTYDSGLQQFLLTAESTTWGKAVLTGFAQPAVGGGAATWVFAFNLDVQRTVDTGLKPLINLSNLPLIDVQLSGANTLSVAAQVLVTSAPILPALAATLNGNLPPGYPTFPVDGFKGTVGFALTLNFAGLLLPLTLGLTGSDDVSLISTASQSGVGTPSTANSSPPVATPLPPTSDGTIWANVQKAFGPVLIEQVGVRFENGLIWFLMNANLRLTQLEMDMIGLRVGTPLDTFAPQFDIDGLGIDYRTPGLEIGGALINMRPPTGFQYAGMAVIKAAGISASVMGSYGSFAGPSGNVTTLFLYGQVKGIALGNPCFLITALSAGVGYNSRLRIPSAADVGYFPFVTSLSATAPATTPMDMLTSMMRGSAGQAAWVTASAGQFWVAAGLSFSSFGFLSVNALAVLQFGTGLQVALLGQATAQFPKVGTALARIQLNLSASYNDAEGALMIMAILTSGSYVLDASARITGGFAFASWFRGVHAGDFVLSVGGYHPRFAVPTWYPQVARVGFSWSLGSNVSLTGGAYMAMTPGAMMVGGSLNLTFQLDRLRAWFNASFDALVKFVPFAFDLSVGVNIGVSYTMDNWLCTKTHTAEVGANLALWGPPTGGTARVEWWVLSFTITFGAARPSGNAATRNASWTEFTQVLPPAQQCVSIAANDGMQGTADNAWLVSSEGLSITIDSAVPVSNLYVVKSATSTTNIVTTQVGAPAAAINIRPMGMYGVTSALTVQLTKLGAAGTAATTMDLSTWPAQTTTRNVPKALWGPSVTGTPMPTGVQLVPNQRSGLVLQTPAAQLGPLTGNVSWANLTANARTEQLPMPLSLSSGIVGTTPTVDDQALHAIIDDMNQPTTMQHRRDNLTTLQQLGFDLATSGTAQIDFSVESYFVAEPLILLSTPHA